MGAFKNPMLLLGPLNQELSNIVFLKVLQVILKSSEDGVTALNKIFWQTQDMIYLHIINWLQGKGKLKE